MSPRGRARGAADHAAGARRAAAPRDTAGRAPRGAAPAAPRTRPHSGRPAGFGRVKQRLPWMELVQQIQRFAGRRHRTSRLPRLLVGRIRPHAVHLTQERSVRSRGLELRRPLHDCVSTGTSRSLRWERAETSFCCRQLQRPLTSVNSCRAVASASTHSPKGDLACPPLQFQLPRFSRGQRPCRPLAAPSAAFAMNRQPGNQKGPGPASASATACRGDRRQGKHAFAVLVRCRAVELTSTSSIERINSALSRDPLIRRPAETSGPGPSWMRSTWRQSAAPDTGYTASGVPGSSFFATRFAQLTSVDTRTLKTTLIGGICVRGGDRFRYTFARLMRACSATSTGFDSLCVRFAPSLCSPNSAGVQISPNRMQDNLTRHICCRIFFTAI